jgi:hypothetical protein
MAGDVVAALIGLAFLAALVPLTVLGARFAKHHRGSAMAVGSLLLMFGVNVQVTPPPPPRIEVVEHEEEKAGDDEPKG